MGGGGGGDAGGGGGGSGVFSVHIQKTTGTSTISNNDAEKHWFLSSSFSVDNLGKAFFADTSTSTSTPTASTTKTTVTPIEDKNFISNKSSIDRMDDFVLMRRHNDVQKAGLVAGGLAVGTVKAKAKPQPKAKPKAKPKAAW